MLSPTAIMVIVFFDNSRQIVFNQDSYQKQLISRINAKASILRSKVWLRADDSGFIFYMISVLWCLKLHLECIIEWYLKNIAEVSVFSLSKHCCFE